MAFAVMRVPAVRVVTTVALPRGPARTFMALPESSMTSHSRGAWRGTKSVIEPSHSSLALWSSTNRSGPASITTGGGGVGTCGEHHAVPQYPWRVPPTACRRRRPRWRWSSGEGSAHRSCWCSATSRCLGGSFSSWRSCLALMATALACSRRCRTQRGPFDEPGVRQLRRDARGRRAAAPLSYRLR